MTVQINRPISNFSGSGVVIGCSAQHSFCGTELHDGDNFYSIDANSEQNPDLVMDIRDVLPTGFEKRFQLTMLEHLDFQAYNEPPPQLIKAHKKNKTDFLTQDRVRL